MAHRRRALTAPLRPPGSARRGRASRCVPPVLRNKAPYLSFTRRGRQDGCLGRAHRHESGGLCGQNDEPCCFDVPEHESCRIRGPDDPTTQAGSDGVRCDTGTSRCSKHRHGSQHRCEMCLGRSCCGVERSKGIICRGSSSGRRSRAAHASPSTGIGCSSWDIHERSEQGSR